MGSVLSGDGRPGPGLLVKSFASCLEVAISPEQHTSGSSNWEPVKNTDFQVSPHTSEISSCSSQDLSMIHRFIKL